MASNKIIRVGPTAVLATVGNLLNPGTTTGGVGFGTPQNLYAILKHFRVVNKTAGGVSLSMWIGATGGSASGTEFGFSGTIVPANSFVEYYGQLALEAADFLTAQAGAVTSLVFHAEIEIGAR